MDTVEKIDENTLKITTAQAPKEELVSLDTLKKEKDRLTAELPGLDAYYQAEVAFRNDRIKEIEGLLATADTLSVAEAIT